MSKDNNKDPDEDQEEKCKECKKPVCGWCGECMDIDCNMGSCTCGKVRA